jgi:glycerol-3-phosphate dehydrogenase (NAD(P)+)
LSTLTKIGIIGLGAWGRAIAKLLSSKMGVLAYARNNKKDMPYCPQTTNLDDLKDRNLIFIATPVGSFESVLKEINNLLSPEIIMWGSKGIDQSTGLLPHQIFEKTIGNDRAAGISFSGPTFSGELSEGLPSAVALASVNTKALNQVSELLKGTNIRSYQTQDIMGVELAGATKNIYAICSGIMAKKGLGENAQAAFITRALHEMANLGDSMGADKNTFYGLSGIGDLVLTSYGQASRNRAKVVRMLFLK